MPDTQGVALGYVLIALSGRTFSSGLIYQTFGGEELYPSVEEKAAMLLYLVVKNHSFSDGNKRIAAMLFLWFMDKNHVLYGENGSKRIADNSYDLYSETEQAPSLRVLRTYIHLRRTAVRLYGVLRA